MASACAFDNWRADPYFTAAEEVQESADIMESVYRMWVRERDGLASKSLDELRRELLVAFGTAKWQLEEFVKAVNSSHESCSPLNDNTFTRRKEFIDTIGNQISCIQKALSESRVGDVNPSLFLVQLDDKERDDLAAFLSAPPPHKRSQNPKAVHLGTSITSIQEGNSSDSFQTFNEHAKESFEGAVEKLNCPQRTLSSPDIGSWKIMVDDKDDRGRRKRVESSKNSPSFKYIKSGLFRNSFPKKGSTETKHQYKKSLLSYGKLKEETCFSRGVNKKENEVLRRGVGSTSYLQSRQMTLLLIITIVLVVPFVLYST